MVFLGPLLFLLFFPPISISLPAEFDITSTPLWSSLGALAQDPATTAADIKALIKNTFLDPALFSSRSSALVGVRCNTTNTSPTYINAMVAISSVYKREGRLYNPGGMCLRYFSLNGCNLGMCRVAGSGIRASWMAFANSAWFVAVGCAREIGGEWYASGESDFAAGTVVGVSGGE